ncbi:MAG TPA: M23 family metallopeptidase [Verrucomicrobiae bacterium]|nr:M23 family metallopeptidase [Verrucomicrobiae bacterium]
MPNPSPLRLFISRIALAALRALGGLKNLALQVLKPLAPAAQAVGRFIGRSLLLPAYRLFVMLRLRVGRLALSARGFVFLVFTHRYVLHGVLAALCLATIISQLQPHEASALDSGQGSILYSLVADGQDAEVQEDARPELAQKDTNYLGQETITGGGGIDYDYTADDIPADLTVPGNIALLPGADQTASAPTTDIQVERTKTEYYTVQPGDVISVIASRFGVTIGTVLYANNLTSRSVIKPGLTLKIPPVSGILHTVAKGDTLQKIANAYDANLNDILAFNHLESGDKLNPGDELMVPGGTPPAPVSRPVATASSNNNASTASSAPTTNIPSAHPAAPPSSSANTTAKFLWPSDLHVINQYYGWQHTGVDIDGDYTNPIYAAADGVVEEAGWNAGGYGLMVLIDHGNGNKTRYGHASKLFVKTGDTVKRGQVIGMIGTTGRSTGTHLHFEVYINNKRVNPLAYIK